MRTKTMSDTLETGLLIIAIAIGLTNLLIAVVTLALAKLCVNSVTQKSGTCQIPHEQRHQEKKEIP